MQKEQKVEETASSSSFLEEIQNNIVDLTQLNVDHILWGERGARGVLVGAGKGEGGAGSPGAISVYWYDDMYRHVVVSHIIGTAAAADPASILKWVSGHHRRPRVYPKKNAFQTVTAESTP